MPHGEAKCAHEGVGQAVWYCRPSRKLRILPDAVISEFFKEGGTKMYAIIATGGKQYKVSEGDVIDIEKIDVEAGNSVTFDQVLAVSGDALKVAGDVAGATVTGTVLDQGKQRKVVVYRYKRKTGYHKKNGHRQPYTSVRIDQING
jgi:large subunit ribosomal protein L21